MNIKKNIKNPFGWYVVSAAMFFLALPLSAQSGQNMPAAGSTEPLYVLNLVWTEEQYALRYEVVIEQRTAGGYQGHLREFTMASSISLSLPVGQYRCRIIPYDFLDRPGEGSSWADFNVRPAKAPVTVALKEKEPKKKEPSVPKEPREKKESQKAFDIYLGAEWAPVIPAYGKELNEFLGFNFTAAGAAIRFDMVFYKPEVLNLGFEVKVPWYWYKAADQHVIGGDLNMLAQKWLPNGNMAFRIRAGGGLSYLPGNPYASVSLQEGIHINVGGSFIWLPLEHFCLETGADFSHFFTEDRSGCFTLFIGAGVRF